jgi:hypothetical protein
MAVSTHIKKLRQRLLTLPDSRPVLSWFFALLGGGVVYIACFGFVGVYAVLDLGYGLADSPDEYPGLFTWSICTLVSLILSVMFLSGCFLIWSRLRRYIIAL